MQNEVSESLPASGKDNDSLIKALNIVNEKGVEFSSFEDWLSFAESDELTGLIVAAVLSERIDPREIIDIPDEINSTTTSRELLVEDLFKGSDQAVLIDMISVIKRFYLEEFKCQLTSMLMQ